jgi:hypothetical protein
MTEDNREPPVAAIVTALLLATALAAGCVAVSMPQTFEGDRLTLVYPGRWSTIDPDEMRQYPGGELLFVAYPPDDGTSVNLTRTAFENGDDIDDVDRREWAAFEASNPGVILESREIIEVGGQPAARRDYSIPYEGVPGGRAHLIQVYIVDSGSLYVLTGWAPSADALRQHQAEIEGIVASIRFVR